MKPTEFALGRGRVEFWDFDFIDARRPLVEQVENLKEDLAQIAFGEGLLVDVGWYPSFSNAGRFVVVVVERFDWDAPLMRLECRSVEELRIAVERAAALAEARSHA